MTSDPKRRFSDRVEAYRKHRPTYPTALIDYLTDQCGLGPSTRAADVGSGTGIFSSLLLPHVAHVYAVEPNAAMRAAAEADLAGRTGFISVAGSAEETTLPDRSVDVVTAAQAFHWFRPAEAHREFRRILRSAGQVVLVWNSRRHGGSSFLDGYEDLLLRWGTDYGEVRARWDADSALQEWFSDGATRASFDHVQVLDYPGLEGRLVSSSYTPARGHPSHEPMLADLRRLFDREQRDGRVELLYDTEAYHGSLG